MKILLTLALTLILYPYPVMALPAGGRVAAGSAGISKPNGQNLNINQLSDKAIINWKGFSINVNELVRFMQPSSKSIVLNRVTGVDPSSILGRLVANGRVFIINPNGILFGPNSVVDVAGLLATTLNIKDADFIAGKFSFSQGPGKSPSYVINQGQIRVSDNGFVFLVAPGVSNEGLVIANLGKVVMGSGEKLTVDFMGDGLITFAIEGKVLDQVTGPDGAPLSSAVANTGTIKSDGGQVILSARASSEIFSSVVNNSGVIQARSLVSQGGVIRLEGSDPVPNTGEIGWQANLGKAQNADGRVLNTGTLDVSAREAGAAPGEVTLSGQMVGVSGSILARGAEGAQGGRVLVTSSEKTILTKDSVIDTSGVGNLSAGNAVIWSDKDTVFRGTIIAKGGETGGNGGQIEVSGHENLSFTGQVNALAPLGTTGSLLLDPLNITVATGGGATLPQVDQFSDTPATNQTIAPATINGALANVVLQANNDITVTNAIAMTNSGVGITMQAGRDINVNAGISTTNGNISLTANDSTAIGANRANATTGDIAFAAGANLSAGTGNMTLTIDPSTTNPFNPGSITTVRNLTTTSGNISINSPNDVTLSGAVNAGSGTVTINANADAAGAQGFTMNVGSSITTTGGVNVNVNAAGGGTGTAVLRDISTSGTLTVQTNTGGNTTGGAISQTAGTTITAGTANLSTGNGAITLNTATNDFGTVAVSRATNVTLQDANSLNLGASTISGTLSITAAGAITDSGNLAVTGTTTLAAGAGNDITLDSAGNNFSTVGITSGRNVTLVDSNALDLAASTVSGTLSVTTAGAITDSGNLTVTGTTTLAAGAGNDITLNNANNFSTVSISSGRNVTLNDTNPLDLGASNISGTLNVTTAGAITDSGNLTVTGTTTLAAGAGNDITLDSAGNNFSTVAITSGRNVTLVDSNALNFGTSTVSGTLNVTTAGTITDSGNMVVTGTTTLAAGAGNDITLDNANNFSTIAITSGRNVTLNDTNALVLGASTVSGTLAVTTAGAITQSGALNVTGTTSLAAGAANDITLNNASNNFSTVGITSGRNVTLVDSNALDLGTSTIAGTLNMTAAGTITDSGNLAVTGTTTLAAGAGNDITLDNANNFSTVAITSGRNVTLNDTNALILGASTVSGALNVTTNGAITQSGALNVTGATTLASGAGNNITLNNASNNFSTVAITSGNAVVLTDANALDLGASTISGTLNVTTAGAITDSGNLTVTGTTTLAAGAGNDITLDSAGNNFSTVAITSGRNVTLVDSNALNFGTSTVSGILNVTTAGTITDSGNMVVTGTTTLAAGAGNDITLDSAGNNFGTVSVISGNNVTLRDTNALDLGASTISGTLSVTTAGAITDSGNLNITGTTTLAAGAGNDITLDSAGNNFSTVAITSGRNVTLVDADALNLGASTVSGTLNVTAGGAITDSGNLTITGMTTLAAGAGNDITLDNANNFGTVSITSGRNVTLNDTNALILGTSTVSGTLGVTTNGAISQSGALNVTGTTSLAAGAANDITLNNASNNFSTVGITSGRNVTLVDSNALDLGASNVSGALNLTAGGAVTESGVLNITGSTSLTATAANTDILLNTQPNNFGGGVTFAGTQSNFRDIGLRNTNAGAVVPVLSGLANLRNLDLIHDNAGVTLPTLNAAGAMNVIAGGAITQSGNVNVTGITTLNSGASDITLGNAGNNFSTVVVSSGNNVILRDINALNLGASTISGTLSVTTAGALTDSGNLSVTGTTTLTAGAGNDIILDSAGNNFSTVAITSGRNVTLVDSNALDLGTSTISDNLNVTTAGAITDSGNLNVSGTTTLAAGAGNDITLDSAANNFSTVAITSGRNVTLVDSNALDLGASTVFGTLNVTTNGAITQSGALNVAATTALSAGAGNNITLNNASNDFSTVAVTSGGNVTLVDSNALDLGTSTISGTLNVTTSGALTQSGPVAVTGATTLAAGASDITLDNAANDFSTLGITSANNVTLQDRNDISLTSSTLAGNFSVTAGGAILDGDGSAINITATTANLIAASNIGTVVDPLETSVGTLNASTVGGGIFVSEANAVTLGNVSAGGGNDIVISNTGGNMTVNSVTTARGAVTLASPGGAIQDGNGGSNNVTANNLTVSSSNGIDLDTSVNTLTSANVTGVGSIDISNIGALTVTNVTTANGNIALNATGGDLAITTVTAGGSGGNVTLSTTTSGAVLLGAVSAPNTVAVNSAGAITDTNGGTNNITAVTANLVAATNIGASVDPIETTVGTLNATTTVGGIFISEADAITLGNVSAGGGNTVVISNTTSDMRVDSVTAFGATVSLTAPGGGILDGNGSANNVTANSLTVTAATGISLDTTINTLSSASVTGAGSINISNNGPLSVANATTTNGNIALNATSGDLDITSVNAGGAGAGVTVSTTTSGNVNLGFVTAPDQVTITSAVAITDGNGAANNITATTANLTATTNIGSTPDPLETAVQTLNATATAGGISITEADGVTLNNIVAGGGNVTISNTAGDMIINSITATGGGIDLTASAGSILDGNGAANNLTAVADSNLRALGGVIGLSTDPIEVNINPGVLGVAATGQVGGVSVDINGTLLPSGALTLLNSPPGEVIFNSRVLNPSPVNLPNLTGIAAELNPQRANEDDYFTELLLDVLGEDFVKARPLYYKLDDSLQVELDSNLCTEDDR